MTSPGSVLARVGLAATLALGACVPAHSQQPQCIDDAMLVFDGSGSMAEMGYNGLGLPRIFEAREAMQRAMPPITTMRKVGLIIYGPGTKDECSNIELRFPPLPDSANRIIGDIDNLAPAGNTPLTRAVGDAAVLLSEEQKTGVVVLVTDGKETCGGNPCALAAQLAAGHRIMVHVIGFKLRGDYFKWNSQKTDEDEEPPSIARCLADMTGGKYFSTESTDELIDALRETLACPLIGWKRSGANPVRWLPETTQSVAANRSLRFSSSAWRLKPVSALSLR